MNKQQKDMLRYIAEMSVILAIGFWIFVLPAHASSTYCINSSWLAQSTTIYNQDTGANVIKWIDPIQCRYGCDQNNNVCNPSQWETVTGPIGSWGLIGMIVFFLAFLIIAAKVFNR